MMVVDVDMHDALVAHTKGAGKRSAVEPSESEPRGIQGKPVDDEVGEGHAAASRLHSSRMLRVIRLQTFKSS
jgi:hypothetical protein